jgi:tight adherence protein C
MSTPLIIFLSVLVVAAAVGSWALVANHRRAVLIARATEQPDSAVPRRLVMRTGEATMGQRWHRTLEQLLPEGMLGETTAMRLVRAGFDASSAPAIYLLLRVVSAVVFPALTLVFVSRDSEPLYIASVACSVAFGLMLPPYVLLRTEQGRKLRILRSVPDCLDLLLVCVEAGVSLDAAVLRVGHEMEDMHPELARELLVINRKANAGMRRDDALHGLYDRTGVEELRALSSTMIQSERWGSSIGRVLRVYSESLRRKRRQSAERRAATAATKMIFPMVLCILPALFAIIGGPMVIGLGPVFDVFGQ